MRKVFIIYALLGFIAAGCFTNAPSATLAIPSVNSLTNPYPVNTLTIEPISTTTPSQVMGLPIITPSPNVVTTIRSDEILNSFKVNGDCLLPCWWSIIPGKTTIEAVKNIVDKFDGFAIHVLRQETGNFRIRVPDGNIRAKIDMLYGPLQGGVVEWLKLTPSVDYKNSVGEYENSDHLFDPQLAQYFPAYTITAILSIYGEPDAILLSGDATNSPSQDWLYTLTLVYPQAGIRVEYFGEMSGKATFSICPMQTTATLWLWEQGKYSSVEDVYSSSIPFQGWGTGLSKASTLQEKTDLTIDKFYEIFKNAPYDLCFESSVEKWQQ